jgi:UDP-N-acetylmuramoylalanine--D-glutamate ligase
VKALVVGAAVSGRAARRLLLEEGHEVVVYDAAPRAVFDLAEGVSGEWDAGLLRGTDLVVVSPGVPEHAPPIRDALSRGVPVWSEVELAARRLTVPYGAVTGTNGKTTATEAAAAMLAASGLDASPVGNIGSPLSDAVGGGHDVLVVEVSSFQLRFVEEFHPAAAVLLNVAPDHLDWHGTFDAYLAAKSQIHRRQVSGDILVFDEDDPGAVRAVAGARCVLVPVSGIRRASGGGPDGGKLWMGDVAVDLDDLARSDPAYLVDLAAAGLVALHLGATPEGLSAAARRFTPEPHRREPVGEWDGVLWVNDSKATNPHAAVAAIRSYESVVLIAGGRNKGLDVAPIAEEPAVRYVVGIGEAGPEIVAAARRGTTVASLGEAVAAADRVARPGDTVLLAPGCASFDQFLSYADRGDAFKAAVLARKGA